MILSPYSYRKEDQEVCMHPTVWGLPETCFGEEAGCGLAFRGA